ncbi:gibberellin-regulated protein 5-like [Nymphaea colorata]|nr:gibberellin-regulated protein 5-like [Nymphaea colorata]
MEKPVCCLFFLALFFALLAGSSTMAESQQGRVTTSTTAKPWHRHRHSGFAASECPDACSFRCSKTAFHKPCMFYCQECCYKCRCVPPGTYAHKEVCPCYNSWKTKRGGPKCP